MKRIILALFALIGAAYFTPALAVTPIGCQVYATQPSNAFAVGSNPTVPCDKNGSLWTNTAAAAGGTSSNYGASFPSAGTAVGFEDSTGLLMAPGKVDSSNNLFVNCSVGCAGGAFNNNADGVATSSSNGQSAAWLYGFNGTTFDRLRVDGSKNLDVNINAASSPVGVTGIFWQGTQPVSLATIPINAAAATAANQATEITALGTINSTLNLPMQNSGGSVTANLGTIAGVATAANQATEITALGAINSTLNLPMQNSGGTVTATQATGSNLHVVCDSGCSGSGGTSSTVGAAYPSTATAVGATDGTNMQPLKVDGSKNLFVNCSVGCAGGTFNNNADAVATSSSNGQSAAWLYAFNGSTWDRLRDDGSKNLNVNCAVGCAGGTFNNNADAVATSSSNGQSAAWLYAFNGSTWDRLKDDGSKNLDVNVQVSALPAGGANATNQATEITALGTINSTLNLPMQNSGGSVTANLGTIAGAATAAKQPAIGTAGSASVDVLSVQGVSGGVAVPVQGTFWQSTQPVSGTFFQATQPVSLASVPINASASTSALQTTGNTSLSSIATNTGATIGNVGSAVPSEAEYSGAVSSGNLTGIIQADASAPINISTATTTQLVALSSGKKIYVTSYDVIAGGTGNITFEYGTGSNCGTGTTTLTGAYNLTAQAGIAKGNGLGPILFVPASNALCALTSAAQQMSGSLSYTQF